MLGEAGFRDPEFHRMSTFAAGSFVTAARG